VKTPSWGNSTRLCPRKSDSWCECDFKSHVLAPFMPAFPLFARTQECILEIHSFSNKQQDKKIAPHRDGFCTPQHLICSWQRQG